MIEWNGAIGPYTAQKQRDFARVLEHLLPVIGSILRRHAWAAREVLYFDLTAGPGYYTSLDLDTPEGRAILARLNYSKAETA